METINDLLKALDNKVPASIAKRLEGLKKLNEKLVSARAEHEANPTEVSQEKLEEIIDFLKDTQEDIREDLSTLVEQKRSADLKVQEEAKKRVQNEARERREARGKAEAEAEAQAQARRRAQTEAKSKAEAEAQAQAQAQEELEKKQLEEEALKLGGKTDVEKKSKIGWGSLLLGGVLLVATGGAIKYFGSRK